MLVAVIDNYDSFTFNLVHYILNTGVDVEAFRNDKVSIEDLKALDLGAIVISPGHGRPEDAGISLDVVKHFQVGFPFLASVLATRSLPGILGKKLIKNFIKGTWKHHRIRILSPG